MPPLMSEDYDLLRGNNLPKDRTYVFGTYKVKFQSKERFEAARTSIYTAAFVMIAAIALCFMLLIATTYVEMTRLGFTHAQEFESYLLGGFFVFLIYGSVGVILYAGPIVFFWRPLLLLFAPVTVPYLWYRINQIYRTWPAWIFARSVIDYDFFTPWYGSCSSDRIFNPPSLRRPLRRLKW